MAAFTIGLGAAWAVLLPILIFTRSASAPHLSPLDPLMASLFLAVALLMASPIIFLSTLPSALWGATILRRRFPSVPVADLGLATFLGLILAAFFYAPKALVYAPNADDWRSMGYVFGVCTAYFSAAFHSFRRLGGIKTRTSVPEPLSDWRRARRTAAETALGVVAIGWTGILLAVLHALVMIGPSD